MYLPLVTWLTGVSSRALGLPAVHPWRGPCRRVSGDGMRVEPSLMHPEGGSWTEVRTHTPSKLSKVQRTFVSHPLGLLQVSGERITAPSELIVTVSVSISSPVAFFEQHSNESLCCYGVPHLAYLPGSGHATTCATSPCARLSRAPWWGVTPTSTIGTP